MNDVARGETPRHWFEDLADHMGPAYLRYSFTRGTAGEVDFLIEALGITEEMVVADVGCGPGRHCLELAQRGIRSVGIDISRTFLDVARAAAEQAGVVDLTEFVHGDATRLDAVLDPGSVDAVIAMCQGGFGIADPTRHRPGEPKGHDTDPFNLDHDRAVLAGVVSALRPGGRAAISAFSGYFQARWLEESDSFDARSGINHEVTEVMDAVGVAVERDLWTTCYTPRELALLSESQGLTVEDMFSVAPGGYRPTPPGVDSQEFLLLARLQP